MDIFEGRVKAKAFSWQCDVGERSHSGTKDHPSSIAGLLPVNDSASDQSFMDLTASSVEAADQFLQSANVEDSSATRCLVEPPTSEVHGDVVQQRSERCRRYKKLF